MRAALLLIAAGCGFEHGRLPGTVIDAPVGTGDGRVVDTRITDATTGALCLGTAPYEVCVDQAAGDKTLSGAYNTDASSECEPTQPPGWTAAGQPAACFIVAGTLTIDTVASFGGSRPLVLFARTSITINGILDVSSHRDIVPLGPGATTATCSAFTQTPGNTSSGAGGGAGGTFQTAGGNGGDGNATNQEGRAPAALATPMRLRAGCAGQRGGTGDDPPGEPGGGGGAVYLVAGSTITIAGTINASGAGGDNGGANATKSGGSGGGSGGMIKLHAQAITATGGIVMANGGGGASGADQDVGGNFGFDPTLPNARAAGGASISMSGAGGGGFAIGMGAVNGGGATGNNTGGGGGGGGGGYIESNVALTGATVSAGKTSP